MSSTIEVMVNNRHSERPPRPDISYVSADDGCENLRHVRNPMVVLCCSESNLATIQHPTGWWCWVKAERIFFNHPTVVASQSGKYISDRKNQTVEIISNKSCWGLAAMGISYWGIVTSSPAEFLSALWILWSTQSRLRQGPYHEGVSTLGPWSYLGCARWSWE